MENTSFTNKLKHSHYSMNPIKASCADETEVKTAPHNDLSFIEELCKKRKKSPMYAMEYIAWAELRTLMGYFI